ncbi:DNA-binding protein [Sulfuricurvum sp. IAE1]|uniref:helix-turn-helix domain-containing protein n=1 Tax=Sulfuricurvum sp. IAE1 TaxID=2546102 RepID=UPI0010520799|nr:helix-turn-helix domain-containing protein [Sulfuricurvum sp. IAE1]TDA65780.1 DNA-binding protein [Sulfuricurvum sp. IAE1]
MTKSELAELLGISRQAVGQQIAGTSKKKEYIRKMMKILLGLKKDEAEKILSSIPPSECAVMLTEKEVSELTKYSINTLRQYRCSGKGPSFNVGEGKKGRITYLQEDVEKWLSEQKRRPKNSKIKDMDG